jgi:hypothetical protein
MAPRCALLAGALSVVCLGCLASPEIGDVTLVAGDPAAGGRYEGAGPPVRERACTTWLLLFAAWGDEDGDTALVGRALERANAQVLVDAKVTHEMTGVPPFYARECRVVEGRPARLPAKEGAR